MEKLFSTSFESKLIKVGLIHISKLQTDQYSIDNNRCFHLRNNGTISYLPKGKECEFLEGEQWSRKNRVEMKIGKAIRLILTDHIIEFTDKDIETANNILKAICDDSNEQKETFKIVSGNDITKYYSNKHTNNNTGTLCNSCMLGKDYFNVYTFNSSIVSMLILIDNNDKISGRAILWSYENKVYMDRIYGSDSTIEKFKLYAQDAGYYYKYLQSYDSTKFVHASHETIQLRLLIPLKIDTSWQFPYIDTFKYIYDDGLATYDNGESIGIADRTGGDYTSNESHDECNGCGCEIDRDECSYVGDSIYCNDCTCYDEIADESILECDSICLNDGRYTSRYNNDVTQIGRNWYATDDEAIIYIESVSEYCLIDDVKYCDYNEEYYLNDDVTYCEGLNQYIHNDDVATAYKDAGYTLIDGEWTNETSEVVSIPEHLINPVNDPNQLKLPLTEVTETILFNELEYTIFTGKRSGKYIIYNGAQVYVTNYLKYMSKQRIAA